MCLEPYDSGDFEFVVGGTPGKIFRVVDAKTFEKGGLYKVQISRSSS